MYAGWQAQTASASIDLSQHASIPGCEAHYYAEPAVSSPAAADTIASTYCSYPRRDGQAEWSV